MAHIFEDNPLANNFIITNNSPYDHYNLSEGSINIPPGASGTLQEFSVDFCLFKYKYYFYAAVRSWFDQGILTAVPINGDSPIVCPWQPGGSGSTVKDGVADIPELKALDTTTALAFPDKVLILVEDSGTYRLDRQSMALEDVPRIVTPTTGSGRWFRITSIFADQLPEGTEVDAPILEDNSRKVPNTSWVRALLGSAYQATSDILTSLSSLTTDGFLVKAGNAITSVTTIAVSSIEAFAANVLAVVGSVLQEPTGFPNQTDTVMTFDDETRTFTISPVGAAFTFWVMGVQFVKTSPQTYQISDVEGAHFIFFNSSGVLTESLTFDPSLITAGAFCEYIYWDTTPLNKRAIFRGEERHGIVMDSATHLHLHRTFGARYVSGFALQNFIADGDGSLDAHAQFTAGSGQMNDEDIQHVHGTSTQIPIFYRLGITGAWRRKDKDAFPLIYSGTAGYTGVEGHIPFNQFVGGAWQLTEANHSEWVLVHYFATNDPTQPVIGIQGINSYLTLSGARLGASSEIGQMAGLPFPEFVPIGTVIFGTYHTLGNTPKALVASYSASQVYADLRLSNSYNLLGYSGAHGLLTGLDKNDHPQYLLKSVLTSLGQIFVKGVTEVVALDVGVDKTVLTADSSSSVGLSYQVPLPQVLTPLHATTTLTINVAVPTPLTGMTVTPGAGTYRVTFIGGNITANSNSDRTITFTIYANGVPLTTSAKTVGTTTSNTENALVVLEDKVTVAAGQAIDIRWQGSNAGTVYSITQRSLLLERCQ